MNYVNLSIDLGRIRKILAENLPWSPLDFIKGISEEGDKGIFVERITSELDQLNDLRFIYKVSDKDELAIFAEKLLWDSQFFGYGVARLNGIFLLSKPYYRPHADYTRALEILVGLARERNIKYLFAPVDPRDLALIRSMGNLGFCLIETRVYYHRDIRNYEYKERYQVRAAEQKDIESLGAAAVKMVNIYDRFRSDPFIAPEDADRLMSKWIEASILEKFADITLVPDSHRPTGFVTAKYDKDSWKKWGLNVSHSVLMVVGAEHRGWGKKLVSEVIYHYQGIGAEHYYAITQVTNRAMISIFEGLGLRFGRCEYVFRMVL